MQYNLSVMSEIGEFVRSAIDWSGGGSYRPAYFDAARAVEATVAKTDGVVSAGEVSVARFIKTNWDLIAFMGMPRALPIPMKLPFEIKRVIPSFNVHHGAEEIVSTVVSETLLAGGLPDAFDVNSTGRFEVKGRRLMLPIGLLNGLLGSVIFNPVNVDETLEGDYWIAISDFKMFISELWGRRDLAERIINFYRR